MKQVYSFNECSDRATRMIPHSRFPILALSMAAWSELAEWLSCGMFAFLRHVHTIHDMSIDIVTPQMLIVRRRLNLNRHVIKENHSTLKIYHYLNKKQPSFFSVYPTPRRRCQLTYVHTAVCRSTFFVENRQNVDQLDMSINKKILYETCRHDI